MPGRKNTGKTLGLLGDTLGPSRAARLSKTSKSTVCYWRKKNLDPNFHCQPHDGIRKLKFSSREYNYVIKVMLEIWKKDPSTNLSEYKRRLCEKSFHVSTSWISNVFLAMGMSWKLSTEESKRKYTSKNIKYYLIYISAILTIEPSRIKFLDESHFCDRKTLKRKILCPKGKSLVIQTSGNLHFDVSMLLLTGLDQDALFFCSTLTGTVDGGKFFDFVCEAVDLGFLRAGDFLIMDNAVTMRVSIQRDKRLGKKSPSH